MSPKQFVCPGDADAAVFNVAQESGRRFDYYDVWDFGPEPTKDHVSYAYHMPYTYNLRGVPTSFCLSDASHPSLAVLADRSPAGPGNSPSHNGEGQNVAFVDGRVEFTKTPTAGLDGDNIYMVGTDTIPDFGSGPRDRLDSVLVNQP
jgi:prepilin-type processing-associated H-X9-DG protein